MTFTQAVGLPARITADLLLAAMPSRAVLWAIGIGILLGTIWGVVSIIDRRRSHRPQAAIPAARPARAKTLFDDLCAAHALTDQEQKVLRDAAELLELTAPSRFFVDPGLLRNASAQACPDDAQALRSLLDRLFPRMSAPQQQPTGSPAGTAADASRNSSAPA